MKRQLDAVLLLLRDLCFRYQIRPENVVGHSDIAPGRKPDPGPLFPWKWLYSNGVGAWYDDPVPSCCMEDHSRTMEKLREYGYKHEDNDPRVEAIVRAFQMHFMPQDVTGKITNQMNGVLYLLCQKYIQNNDNKL